MYEFPGVNIFKWLLILPMAIPTYVNGYIYSGLNETSGILFNVMEYYFGLGPYVYNLYDLQNIYGVIFIMTISLYPYVYLLCLPAFANHSYSVFEVGKSLGLNKYQRLTKIGLPIVRPAVVAGVSFVIMETLAEYATMEYFGVPTFATGIFRAWFVLGDEVSSFRLSSILLTLVFFLIYFEEMSRGKRKFDNPTNKIYERKKEVPKNKTQLVILCSLIVFFGSILQFFQIFYWISYSLDRVNILFIFELITSSASIASNRGNSNRFIHTQYSIYIKGHKKHIYHIVYKNIFPWLCYPRCRFSCRHNHPDFIYGKSYIKCIRLSTRKSFIRNIFSFANSLSSSFLNYLHKNYRLWL